MEKKLLGLCALVLVACGGAEELAAEIADDAGELLEDAGVMLSDAGSALADAGHQLVDAGAHVDTGTAQAMDDGPAYDDEPVLPVLRDAGSVGEPVAKDAGTVTQDAGTVVVPVPPLAVLTYTATCSTIFGGRTAEGFIDDLEYYAEIKIASIDPAAITGATAWMCGYEKLASFKDPQNCTGPACIPQYAGVKPQPTCQAGIVEVTSGQSGGTFARVKCGFRKTNPGVYDYGDKFKTVKITINL